MNNIGYDKRRIKDSFYNIEKGPKIEVEETNDGGRAKLDMNFDSYQNKTFIKLLQETNTSWLSYLKNCKCADGVIIEINKTGSSGCNIYIAELKRTVDSDKWSSDIKHQFRGATLRALSFLSTLGITQIDKIQYYTGFVNDKMGNDIRMIKLQKNIKDTSIIGKKAMVGIKAEEILEWNNDKIKIFEKEYLHYKIKLKDNKDDLPAKGSVDIKNN